MNKKIGQTIAIIVLFFVNPLAILLLSKSYLFTLIVVIGFIGITFFCVQSCRKWVKIIGFNLVAVFSVLLYAETIFRFFYQDRNIPVIYEPREHYYFNRPYLKDLFCTKEYSTIYSTDCKGYRIDDNANPDIPIQKGTILFLGDSFTQGAQVQYSEMFSSLVGKYFPMQKIVNAGISGAGIVDEYYYYIDEGQNFGCKTIFLEIGVFNDFFNIKEQNASWEETILDKSHLYTYLKFQMNEYESKKKIERWTEPFFENKQDNIDNNILYKESSDVKERDKRNFIIVLKTLNEKINSNGGKLVVVLIPSKEQVSSKMLREVEKVYGISMSELDMTYPNRWMNKQTKSLGIDLIDLLDDFKKSQVFPFFQIDEHMNVYGHQIVSSAIIKYMEHKK